MLSHHGFWPLVYHRPLLSCRFKVKPLHLISNQRQDKSSVILTQVNVALWLSVTQEWTVKCSPQLSEAVHSDPEVFILGFCVAVCMFSPTSQHLGKGVVGVQHWIPHVLWNSNMLYHRSGCSYDCDMCLSISKAVRFKMHGPSLLMNSDSLLLLCKFSFSAAIHN